MMMVVQTILSAQHVLDAEERKHQILYIQQDTIPVEVDEVSEVINTQFSEYNGVLFPDSSFFFSSLRPESEFGRIIQINYRIFLVMHSMHL